MDTRIVIRDNGSERSIQICAEMSQRDLDFLNYLGERIAQDTGWQIALVAVKKNA